MAPAVHAKGGSIEPPADDARTTGGARECLLAALGFVLLLVTEFGVTSWTEPAAAPGGAWSLFSRNFWLDELYTHTLVADPSFAHALGALAAGVETHPPAYYVLLRTFTGVAGTSEIALRTFSLAAALLGFVGVYGVLRRTFRPLVAFTALALLWCHPLVVLYAFEARFYALWLAAVAWYAFFLDRCGDERAGLGVKVGVALTAVLTCTVHYFGVISLALVTIGELIGRRRSGQPSRRGLAWASAGPLALALCLPLLLRQRGATTVPTWLDPVTLDGVRGFLTDLYAYRPFAPAVIALGLCQLLGHRPPATSVGAPGPQWGLSALLAMPLVMIGFSLVVQPAVLARYALPTLLGLAPATAYLLARLPAIALIALWPVYAFVGAAELGEQARQGVRDDARTAELIANIRERTGGEPVVFESPAQLYVACRYASDVAPRCSLLDFEEGEIPFTPRSRVFVRDLARRYAQFYDRPRVARWADVRKLGHFYMVPSFFTGGEPGVYKAAPYPGFLARPVSRDLYELARTQR